MPILPESKSPYIFSESGVWSVYSDLSLSAMSARSCTALTPCGPAKSAFLLSLSSTLPPCCQIIGQSRQTVSSLPEIG